MPHRPDAGVTPAATDPGGAVPEPLTRSFDVLAIGRVGVDLYPMQTAVARGRRRPSASSSAAAPATSPSRRPGYGHTARSISRTGDDPFGRFVDRALPSSGRHRLT